MNIKHLASMVLVSLLLSASSALGLELGPKLENGVMPAGQARFCAERPDLCQARAAQPLQAVSMADLDELQQIARQVNWIDGFTLSGTAEDPNYWGFPKTAENFPGIVTYPGRPFYGHCIAIALLAQWEAHHIHGIPQQQLRLAYVKISPEIYEDLGLDLSLLGPLDGLHVDENGEPYILHVVLVVVSTDNDYVIDPNQEEVTTVNALEEFGYDFQLFQGGEDPKSWYPAKRLQLSSAD